MVETKTINKCCIGWAIFFAVILFLANVIFSFNYYEYDFDNNSIMSEIIDNLNGKLILSLSAKDECEKDENKLIFGKWDGLSDGCYCEGPKTYQRACRSGEIRDGCKDVSTKKKNYMKINNKYLCVKYSEKTYNELLKSDKVVSKNNECPKGYESCGIIDTFENKYCADKIENCPINLDRLNDSFELNMQNEFESYPIGYDYKLNKKLNNQIISLIQLSEDKYPCIYPGEKTWNYNYQFEATSKNCSTKVLETFYDERYEILKNYNTTKKDLYIDNEIPSYGAPKGDIYKSVYLYGRSFIGFDKEKFDEIPKDSIISVQKVSNNCGTVMNVLSIALLIFLSLPIIAACICIGGTGGHPPKCSGNECGCVFLTCGIGGGITAALAFVIDFILCIIIFVCSIILKSKLSFKVSDDYTNELIQLLIDDGSKNFGFSRTIVIIIGLDLVPLIILLINFIRKGELEL